jgi:hypothetical protein
MRNHRLFSIVLLLFTLTGSYAQNDNSVFDPKSKLTWLGLDFSKAKFIGGREEYRRFKLHALLDAWNQLMIDERKYDISRMLHRENTDISFDAVTKHNAGIDVNGLLTDDTKLAKRMNVDSIATIMATYDFGGLSGTGLMFNVESFDAAGKVASVWITFVDMDNKKILFARRIDGKAQGTTWKNLWAGSIFNIMTDVREKYYSRWSNRT